VNTAKEIAEILKKYKSAVIFTHARPDGDTLGSGLALSRALSRLGIRAEVVNEGKIPQTFSFLEDVKKIRQTPSFDAECFIAVDSSDENRFGMLQELYLAGAKKKPTVSIDHHVSNTRYAKYNFVRERSSNSENIVAVIREMGVEIDKETANLLMLGMITDSGNFTHSDVDGETFRTAAYLTEAGADCGEINYRVFRCQPRVKASLYADAIGHLKYYFEDKFAATVVTQAMLERHGATPDMTEGIVDFGLTVDTVEVSASLLEIREGQYKVSLRSKGSVNVNAVASTFGGGGHILASGCMIGGSEEEALDRLSFAVSRHLDI